MHLKRPAPTILATVAIVAAACSEPTTPTPSTSPNAAITAPRGAANLPAVARAVPAFGGFYYEDGVPTVSLTDPGQRAAAAAALGVNPSELRVVPARFAYQDLDGWFRGMSYEAFDDAGVVFVDLDEAANRVVVGMEHGAGHASVRSIAARLRMPVEALAIETTEPIYPAATLRDRIRPTQGGIQIHFSQFICTLGFNVTFGGQSSFITNSHCTNRQGGTEGTIYYQPTSTLSGGSIGIEVHDPAYFRGNECPRRKLCRYSDASRALYNSGVTSTVGAIAGTDLDSLTITGTVRITGEGSPVVGQVVRKTGRTTGTTEGAVTRTDVNTAVSGTRFLQLKQTWVAAGVGSGDSGSPVYTAGGTLLGILWGGSTTGSTYVFSPIAQVQQEVGPFQTR